MSNEVDISENGLLEAHPSVFQKLLFDHTTRKNIFWATDSYVDLGEGYLPHDEITIPKITGEHGLVLRPRAVKSHEEQTKRSRDMAEVFTSSWTCNAQNNLVDDAWFGRKHVFNTEMTDAEGNHTWIPTEGKIIFPEGDKEKTWQKYVSSNVIEVTCGEGPYLVSRYDTVTGEPIPVKRRIGLLDRKLRIVSENTETTGDWLKQAQKAFMATYGFEWQGDNLLLAREAMFFSFIDYFKDKFDKLPSEASMEYIAYIISWNLWQMDGLKGVVPDSCKNGVKKTVADLFGAHEETIHCEGCEKNDILRHNGIYCLVREWGHRDPKTKENNRKTRFIDLIKP